MKIVDGDKKVIEIKLSTPTLRINKGLVDLLESALEGAKSGKIINMIGALQYANGTFGIGYTNDFTIKDATYAIELLKNDHREWMANTNND